MKPGSRYRKGYRNEKRSRAYLENQGYLVTEARGSHGLWDLVGVGLLDAVNGDVVLVQVKSNKRPGKGEMEALHAFPRPRFGRKEVHIWHDRRPEPEVIEV